MNDEIPSKLQTAAIVQIVSGVLNIFVMAAVVSTVLFTSMSVVSWVCTSLLAMFLCPAACITAFLPLCGFAGFALVPLGVLEIVAGVMAMNNPAGGVMLQKIVAGLEISSILVGGLTSMIAGGFTLVLLMDEEVVQYLEEQ